MRNLIKTFFLASVMLTSCVSANVDIDSICDTQPLDFASATITTPSPAITATAEQTIHQDFSKPLSKIDSFGDVTIDLHTLTFTAVVGDFDFIQSASVWLITPDNTSLLLAQTDLSAHDPGLKQIDVQLVQNTDQLLSLLRQGPVTLKIRITGTLPKQIPQANASLCVSVSGKFKKSL